MDLGVEFFLNTAKAFNYKVYLQGSGAPGVNIVGYRKISKKCATFEDTISVYRDRGGSWSELSWPAATLPGAPWLLHPMTDKGTAILAPGQYVDAYDIGTHKNYEALVQVAPVRVYRDNDRDSQIDKESANIDTGMFGINIHKAGFWSKVVGLNSAGCQVFQKSADFDEFMDICWEAKRLYETKFTYTLLEV